MDSKEGKEKVPSHESERHTWINVFITIAVGVDDILGEVDCIVGGTRECELPSLPAREAPREDIERGQSCRGRKTIKVRNPGVEP